MLQSSISREGGHRSVDATLLSSRADPVAGQLARFAATHGAPVSPPEATWEALRAAGLDRPGLAFAAWAEITVLGGLVGPIAVNSPDIGSLLDDLERFHPLFGRERIVLTRRPREVSLTLRAPNGLPANPDTVEACFALLCRIIRSMAGGEAGPSRVALRRARPDDTADYETAFAREVAFGQPADICVFTVESLRTPVPDADTVVRSMLRPYAERRIAHQHVPWATAVTDLLQEASQPSLAAAARALAVSPRTLQARLTQEGTSFATLADDLRRERAMTLLSQPDLAVTTIAARLGFSTPSALTRAFRRWTGMAPSDYRREAGVFDATTD
jgi:AraC-like DNA-binding protein